MSMQYVVPPAIIHHVDENRPTYVKPFFYEYDGEFLNLAVATRFYVEHIPFTSLYWACARVGSACYKLAPSMRTNEEAMQFLRELIKKMEATSSPTP